MRELLPKLREIGFGIWDPLGLAGAWKDGEAMADEYDSHLLLAFSAAAEGGDAEAICERLRRAEVCMGLENGGPANRRTIAARELLNLSGRAAAD
ncbi:MAG: hypothetical protein ACKOED_11135 [Aestuariivirga sp.]|uniref:hypothetical protein n=1 Tax=Aestuariivirga sp. TaxID=2650926 RepID=UPI0038D1C1A1